MSEQLRERISRRDFIKRGAVLGVGAASFGAVLSWIAPEVAEAAEATAQTDPTKMYIIDQILCKQGDGSRFLRYYMDNYAPGAKDRGMTLEHTIVSPPVWAAEVPNTLIIIWSVQPGAMGWGGMASKSRWNPEIPKFWKKVDGMVQSRHHYISADESALEDLANV